MGNKVSQCQFCCTELPKPSKASEKSGTQRCGRCHGQMISDDEDDHKVYIEHLHIAPFNEDFEEKKEIDSTYLIKKYLKPHFEECDNVLVQKSQHITIKKVKFKVLSCYPPMGYVSKKTKFHLNGFDNNKLTKLYKSELTQIHCSPTKASLNAFAKKHKFIENEQSDFLMQYSLNPYFKKKRHLSSAEHFSSNGISWIVTKCKPKKNGIVSAATQIFCDGKSIDDLESISIRAIHESLPQIFRNCTPKQLKVNYLDIFINGRLPFIDHSAAEIKIFGALFCVRRSVPFCGLITQQTKIDYLGTAIKRSELTKMQQAEDLEMAKGLLEKMREERLQQRRSANRLRSEWSSPLDFDFAFLNRFIGNNQNMPMEVKRGVSKQIIQRLPTFVWLESKNKNNDDSVCRICLEPYKDGDEMRILPCFHMYHKECADNWLNKFSSKCPICKTDILKRQRRRRQR